MENNVVSLPDVEKISGLITALRDYAVKSAREQWAQNMSSVYLTPRLRCWDECAWFELAKDRQVVAKDIGSKKADVYVMIIVAAVAMWNMGAAFLAGVIMDNALRREWLKI